jgi:hypothetical protein
MTDVYEPALDMSFVYAVRRALGAIYREHTVERVVKVLINGSRPLTRVKEFRHLGDRVETLSLSGKCYSMRTYGEGEIVEVFRKGYRRGDKIIRYAMVKVAN